MRSDTRYVLGVASFLLASPNALYPSLSFFSPRIFQIQTIIILYTVIDCWGGFPHAIGLVESPVYSRRQSSPFVDGTRVGAQRTSGFFRHAQVPPRWSLVLVGRAMPRTSAVPLPSVAAAVPATLLSAAPGTATVPSSSTLNVRNHRPNGVYCSRYKPKSSRLEINLTAQSSRTFSRADVRCNVC
jgi:hypothetical protein